MNGGPARWRMRRVRVEGPSPFVTRRSFTLAGRHSTWRSRSHRKGLDLQQGPGDAPTRPFWHKSGYSWSIGALFALGSFLFMLASVLSLVPAATTGVSALGANIVYFMGSIPFTAAAFLQLVQAANASDFAGDRAAPGARRVVLFGWYPRNAGWLSSFTQFVGTLAFNADTLNAVIDPRGWLVKDAAIWLPDMLGSILFLVSGYLAFIEVSHRYWSWRPSNLGWQIVFINLLGCIAFMTAAVLGYFPPGPEAAWIVPVSTLHTLAGAACFLAGALLTCRESGYFSPAISRRTLTARPGSGLVRRQRR